MIISLRNARNSVIVEISQSEFDFSIVRLLRRVFKDLIKSNQYKIIINMSNIQSIDSSALGFLLNANKICSKKGGQIDLYGVKSDILAIFYIIQIDKYLNIYNCEIDAINKNNVLIRRRLKIV